MARRREIGSTLIELLVTLVILAIGLLGIAGLQARLHVSELEAYQRSEALALLDDMSSRLNGNRKNAASYLTTSPLGSGMTCPTLTTTSTRQQIDTAEWCRALQGAAEQRSGNSVGTVVGGRGCIESLGTNQYMITVAWQGLAPIAAPPGSVGCGANLYDGATGSSCVSDLCRRVVTTVITMGTLN